MAGTKETPRQKLIGMMYLVLMAMLAINVSKEIIHAFVTQDTQLLQTNNNLVMGVNAIQKKFSLLESDLTSKERFKKWKPKMDSVIRLSNQMDDMLLQDLNTLMYTVEKKDKWFVKDKQQYTKWMDIDKIENKEDYDIATRLFGGDKGSKGYQKGANIRSSLHALRDELILLIGNYKEGDKQYFVDESSLKNDKTLQAMLEKQNHPEKDKILMIFQTLNQPKELLNHGELEDWQIVKFDHQPLVGAIGVFTELRNQVRIAEQKALETVFNKMEGVIMKINTIKPQIIADTRYLNIGDTLGVKVGVIAYDSSATYPIKYTIGNQEITKSNNQFTIRGDSPGVKNISGTLLLDLADGKKEFPWNFSYVVGKPQSSISFPEYSVIYRNHDNLIEGAVSGYAPEDVSMSCPECASFTKRGKVYVARVTGAREVTISLKAPGLSYSKKYKVLNLPKPEASFVGMVGDSRVSRATFIQGTKLFVRPPETSPLNPNYQIKSYKVSVNAQGRSINLDKNMGDILSKKNKDALKGIQEGDVATFYDIVYTVNGSKDIPLNNSLTLTITR